MTRNQMNFIVTLMLTYGNDVRKTYQTIGRFMRQGKAKSERMAEQAADMATAAGLDFPETAYYKEISRTTLLGEQ